LGRFWRQHLRVASFSLTNGSRPSPDCPPPSAGWRLPQEVRPLRRRAMRPVSPAPKSRSARQCPIAVRPRPGALSGREALVHARYILAHKPDAKIAILRANDGSTEIVKGLRDGLGDQADKLIVKELTYEVSNPTVNSQIVALKSSGANTFYDVGYTKFASRTSRACGRAARRRSSFRSTWTERGLNVIRRPGVLAQRASKNGGPEIARHPSRLWLCPRT
jgi:hypothetical protein